MRLELTREGERLLRGRLVFERVLLLRMHGQRLASVRDRLLTARYLLPHTNTQLASGTSTGPTGV